MRTWNVGGENSWHAWNKWRCEPCSPYLLLLLLLLDCPRNRGQPLEVSASGAIPAVAQFPIKEEKFAMLLDGSHDRAGFFSGLDSVDRYLRETARGQMEKGVSVTRVMVEIDASLRKTVLGYFTLFCITIDAREWQATPKGLPRQIVSAVLLGRLKVTQIVHGKGCRFHVAGHSPPIGKRDHRAHGRCGLSGGCRH